MLELREFVANANKLFTIPDICLSLNELVAQDNCTIEDIATVVSYDPALCLRILKLANSPLYPHRKKVSSMEQAIAIIGTNELCNIAIATSAALIFKGVGESRINLRDYWYHSVFTAVVSQQIYKDCFGKRQGSLFVVGLLHNIGLLVVLERLPYLSIDLFNFIGLDRLSPSFEKKKLGFYISDVSTGLLQHWQLPMPLIQTISNQHVFPQDSDSGLSLHAAIKIADCAVSGSDSMEVEEIFTQQEIALIGITQEQLEQIVDFANCNIQSVIDIIQG